MIFTTIFIGIIISTRVIVAQQPPTVLCVPGQCVQGYSNTTIGAVLSASGATNNLHLLPGQYSSDTSPVLLHDLLTSSSASISGSSGFNASLSRLPLNLALSPGIAIFPESMYAGQSGFTSLPSTPSFNFSSLSGRSFSLSSTVWIATTSGSSNKRLIIWDSVPDINQLPTNSPGGLTLVDIQSNACSPPCSSSGVCSASGTCQCAPGFTGSSCESCAEGFFGPQCKPCPEGCTICDQGVTGTGQCLKRTVANAPSTCNCLNGVCGSNGQCTCNPGFTTSSNGTACAACSSGFFLTSTGDCKVCQPGCAQCADQTGVCNSCKPGFSQNPNDRTQCFPPKSTTSTGTICPDGSFSNGQSCSTCSSSCETCTGGTSNDCVRCASGLYMLNGGCVSADSNGICQGTNFIADNNKRSCDSCSAKCTSCRIPGFSGASTVNQAQCTACLPGSFLSNGACVESCPSATFPTQDNTCQPCDSSCSTCSGSSTFCLTCSANRLASGGTCVSTCPSNTFTSSGSCLNCHPDCASCSGGSFGQCTSCLANRPVLSNGRCLPVCSKSQFYDTTTSSCQSCDSICSSCSGSGPSNCLACASSSQILRSGSCVNANCQSNTSVVAGLGACLSELVSVPPTSTSGAPPLPSVTGISTPTPKRRPLEWWQILLMALGCAFIFIAFIWCFRRRARKNRTKHAHNRFPTEYRPKPKKSDWRWRLVRFGGKLFGQNQSSRTFPRREWDDTESVRLTKLRAAEEARMMRPGDQDMIKLIGEYQRPVTPGIRRQPTYYSKNGDRDSVSEASHLSAPSIYSQATGMPRRTPEPRQPLNDRGLTSRFSMTTVGAQERSSEDKVLKSRFSMTTIGTQDAMAKRSAGSRRWI